MIDLDDAELDFLRDEQEWLIRQNLLATTATLRISARAHRAGARRCPCGVVLHEDSKYGECDYCRRGPGFDREKRRAYMRDYMKRRREKLAA